MIELIEQNLQKAIIFTLIILATVVLASVFRRVAGKRFLKSAAKVRRDTTRYRFVINAATAVIYIVGFSLAIYAIPSLRTVSRSLLASAGILAVAIGLAAQSALGNLIGGVFIVLFKPFKLGDRIEIQNLRGIVEDITLRHTVIRDFENKHIVIPNSVISSENIVNANLGDDRICKWVDIGISYGSDIDLARKIIQEEVLKHPLNIDGRSQEQIDMGAERVPVRVLGLADFSVNLRAWAWAIGPAEAFQMHCDLLESIKNRFDAEGVEIPFPYRTLVYKTDLPEESKG